MNAHGNPRSPLSLAVLVSGGLDSAILLGDTLRRHSAITPIYVRFGLSWEAVEFTYLQRYLDALRSPALLPLVVLDEPVADIYGSHWSTTGNAPLIGTPEEAVFLPGRNVLLLAKPMLWCHLHGASAIALGSLQTNPFPDATPEFFRAMQDIVNQAVQGNVEVRLPFGGMKKVAVMALGKGLPLEHTFSCASPAGGLHCGRCSKCGERRDAFRDACMTDPTQYHRQGL